MRLGSQVRFAVSGEQDFLVVWNSMLFSRSMRRRASEVEVRI